MNTLVVQLAKMGDLLQTVPLLERLRLEGGGVYVLHNSLFTDVVRMLPVDGSIPVDFATTAELRDDELRLSGDPDISHPALSGFDRVINLNSGLLARDWLERVDAPVRLGFGTEDPWSNRVIRWVLAFIRSRRLAGTNLRDLFRLLPGPVSEAANTAEPFTLRNARWGRVALQLGSRNRKRQWSPARYATLVDRFTAAGFAVVLTGSAEEAEAGARLMSAVSAPDAVENRIGSTGIMELADLLRGCDLLVTGDTGTQHLAAHLGIPLCAFYFGPAYPFETAAPGSLVFMPSGVACYPCPETAPCPNAVACHRTIGPDEVFRQLDGSEPSPHAWMTRSDGFGLTLTPVLSRPQTLTERVAYLYRAFGAWSLTGLLMPEGERYPDPVELLREVKIYRVLPEEKRDPAAFQLLRPVVELERLGGTDHTACLDFLEERI